jgi:iron complex outermembrane receptor protein
MNKLHLVAAASLLAIAAPLAAQTTASNAPSGSAVQPVAGDDGTIADITVTAQRRAEKSQDVPIAISVFSGDQLRAQGVSSALDLGQFVPNLIAQNNTGLGSANAYYLRGLGNTETIPTFDPPVGTYVDQIYLSRQNANNLNLFDVARIEVLRGPQGTLFGKNTTGGAISVILREPGKVLGGYAELGYGSFNKKLARGSIDLPLNDKLQIKISGYWQKDDGYTRDTITNQRLNDDDGWGVRLGVHGDLSDSVHWNASYAHIAANGENILNFVCNPANPTDCSGRFSATGVSKVAGAANFGALNVAGDKRNYGNGNQTDTDLITSDLTIGLGDKLSLDLITGYVAQRQRYALDFFDGRGSPSLANPSPVVTGNARGGFVILDQGFEDQFTQEIKLSGSLFNGFVDFVSGFYYLHEYNKTDFADVFAGSLILGDRVLRNTADDMAGYVQADFNVTSRLKLTAGVRYTDESKTLDVRDNRQVRGTNAAGFATCGTNPAAVPTSLCITTANLTAPTGVPIPTTQTARLWTPRFAIDYRLSDQVLVFASATRGFKSGGWNARSTNPQLLLPFDPEKVWSYETGFKSDLFDRHVRLNLTAYLENVSNLQTLSAFVSPTTGALTFLTRNFADYRNYGLEAELTVIPVKGLNLFANGGYQNDKYKINYNAPAFDQYGVQSVGAQQAACQAQLALGRVGSGPMTTACANGVVTAQGTIATPVRTPDFTLAIGGSYELPLGALSLVPSVNGSYHSKQETGTSNLTFYTPGITGTNGTFSVNPNGGTEVEGSRSEAAWLVNAGVALNGPDKRWQLSVNCTNCLDKAFIQSTLGNYSYLNPPRMWQARARYNF